MLEITIKDTETGKVLERTTKLAVICARVDGGVYAAILGNGNTSDIATVAWALDTARDDLLEYSETAKALYPLRDMIGTQIKINLPNIDTFSNR